MTLADKLREVREVLKENIQQWERDPDVICDEDHGFTPPLLERMRNILAALPDPEEVEDIETIAGEVQGMNDYVDQCKRERDELAAALERIADRDDLGNPITIAKAALKRVEEEKP